MKLFFGFPAYAGSFKAATAISLMRTAQYLATQGIMFETFVWSRDNLPSARNLILARFLESSCTDVIMIDSDIVWEVEAVQALLDHNLDFVAGVYRTKTDTEQYCLKMLDEPRADPRTGLLEVAAVPFGFVRLSRSCVERMTAVYNEKTYRVNGSDLVCHYLFAFEHREGQLLTEDFEFCRKWRAISGKIHIINPSISFTHVGEKNYSGSFGAFLNRFVEENLSIAV